MSMTADEGEERASWRAREGEGSAGPKRAGGQRKSEDGVVNRSWEKMVDRGPTLTELLAVPLFRSVDGVRGAKTNDDPTLELESEDVFRLNDRLYDGRSRLSRIVG